ncbi:MAG: hypothetical protein QW105_02445 [Nitrososphaerota archaeon]
MKGKLEIEFNNIDSLCAQLYTSLQQYGALERFINYSIGFLEIETLKRIEKAIQKRIRELEEIWLSAWDDKAFDAYMSKLSQDAKKLLNEVVRRTRITKTELMELTGFAPMKVAGVLAGMNNMAKKMGRKPVITRRHVRVGHKWDEEYTVEESFLRLYKQKTR